MNRFSLVALLMAGGLWACDDAETEADGPVADAALGAGGEGGAGAAGGQGGAGAAGGAGGAGAAAGEGGAGAAVEAQLQGVAIEEAEAYFAGREHQFKLIGTYDDGSTRDLTAEAEWTADNEDVVHFLETPGLAELPFGGTARVVATLGTQMAEHSVAVVCDYPRFAANIRKDRVVAPVKWDTAFKEDGTEIAFDFREAMCSLEYRDVNAFLLIVNAEWCAPCIQEIRRLGPHAQELRDAGGLILYIVVQNLNYQPATSQVANRHIGRLVGDESPGLRMGGRNAEPQAFFDNPAIIQAFPTAFVVRKSDMMVIADSRNLNYHLDPFFPAILADLSADWSDPAATAVLPFDSNCEEGDEEASEPNDAPAQATVIEPGSYEGGICTAASDFYRINAEGAWTFRIEFSHAQGDIDIALWDEAANAPVRINDMQVVSNSTNDFETLSGTGPALINVIGYGGASATYTITLE